MCLKHIEIIKMLLSRVLSSFESLGEGLFDASMCHKRVISLTAPGHSSHVLHRRIHKHIKRVSTPHYDYSHIKCPIVKKETRADHVCHGLQKIVKILHPAG
jgi:hypothetical protein